MGNCLILRGWHIGQDDIAIEYGPGFLPAPTDVLASSFDIVISVGTSGMFPYIQEPVLAARAAGVPTIEINPGETLLSYSVDYRLPLGAAAS